MSRWAAGERLSPLVGGRTEMKCHDEQNVVEEGSHNTNTGRSTAYKMIW